MTQLKLERGMLLLDPGTDHISPKVWTVVSAKKLVMFGNSIAQEATLTASGLPEGWQVVHNAALARHLVHLAGHDRAFPTGRILHDE